MSDLMTATTAVAVTQSEAATMVSHREVPWMKLGKLVDVPMTAREAAEEGGIDFIASLCPNGYQNDDGEWVTITNRRTVVRQDTGVPLGIVSSGYPVLQYAEAFDFMDAVSPHYVAAGALKGGRQGFMVVEAPEALNVLKGVDPHKLYLVLRTSHDCSRAIEVMVMPLREICMNQLTLQSFSAGVPHRWTVKHTSTMHAKLADAQKALANLGAYAKQYEKTALRLSQLKVTDAQATELLESVFPDRPKRVERITHILHTWHTAPTVGFGGTGWGILNAVSEYQDWGRPGGSPESRFVNALQGSTHITINRVAARLLSRV